MLPKTARTPHAHPPRSHRVQREVAAARLALRRGHHASDEALDRALDALIERATARQCSPFRRTLQVLPVIRVLARHCGPQRSAPRDRVLHWTDVPS